jgi:hypothetical protein
MKLMLKIDLISAWILFICIILYILTGFDIQRRLLVPQISSLIHLKYLFVPAQISFVFHSSYAMNRAFKRRGLSNRLVIGAITIYITANLALMIYYFYIQLFSK